MPENDVRPKPRRRVIRAGPLLLAIIAAGAALIAAALQPLVADRLSRRAKGEQVGNSSAGTVGGREPPEQAAAAASTGAADRPVARGPRAPQRPPPTPPGAVNVNSPVERSTVAGVIYGPVTQDNRR